VPALRHAESSGSWGQRSKASKRGKKEDKENKTRVRVKAGIGRKRTGSVVHERGVKGVIGV